MNLILILFLLFSVINAHNILIIYPSYLSDYNDTIINTCDYNCITNIIWNDEYNINDALKDNSNNIMSLDFETSKIMTVTTGFNYRSICDFYSTQIYVINKIRFDIDLPKYNFIMFIVPNIISCGWEGLAYQDNPKISFIKNTIPRVILHELGHNFGLIHSSINNNDYGDNSDPMGQYNTIQRFSTFNRLKLNWISKQYVKNITRSTGILAVNILSSSIKPKDYNNYVLYTFRNSTNDIFISLRHKNETTYDYLLNDDFDKKILIHSVNKNRNELIKSLSVNQNITIGKYNIKYERFNLTRAKLLIKIKF